MQDLVLWLIAVVLVVITLPGSLELALICVGRLCRPPRGNPHAHGGVVSKVRLAVIVPVFNEEAGLGRTVRSILACSNSLPASDIIVQACNCTDRSVEVARALGCTVIERTDPARRGKGYGLNYAFQTLANSPFDAFLVVDADTVVSPDFLDAFRVLFASGAAAGQCVLKVANHDETRWTRTTDLAFRAFTYLRPLARQRLALSCGLFGNGFGLSAQTLREVPYECFSIAEDLEYHIRLVRAGKKVEFLPGTAVYAEMCPTRVEAKPQRERWEGGRLRVALDSLPQLAADVFLRRRWSLLEPMLELLLLPLSYHVTLLAFALVIGTGWITLLATVGLALVAIHVLQAMLLEDEQTSDWRVIAVVPFYIGGKVLRVGGVLKAASRSSPWIRAPRRPMRDG